MSLPARCLHAHIIKNMMAREGNVSLPDVLDQIFLQITNVELMALTMDGSPIQMKRRQRVKLWRESGNNTATPAQDVSSVNFVTSSSSSSKPQDYPGQGKRLTQNYLVRKPTNQTNLGSNQQTNKTNKPRICTSVNTGSFTLYVRFADSLWIPPHFESILK